MYPSSQLITPYGGDLKNLIVSDERALELRHMSRDLPSWDLTLRQECDLELLLCGGFSPLAGFLGRIDYETVCDRMELADGTLWPIPVQLDVSAGLVGFLQRKGCLVLRDAEGVMVAVLHIEDIWQPDKLAEAKKIYGTTCLDHPGVAYLINRTGPFYVGGRVEGLQPPQRFDNRAIRKTPDGLRNEFAGADWQRVVTFLTRKPPISAEIELIKRLMGQLGANLLVQAVVDDGQPGVVDHFTRVRCYKHVMPDFGTGAAILSLLDLSERMAGPKEVIWHAIISRNHGSCHLIVGRDHACPQNEKSGLPFYAPYQDWEWVKVAAERIGVTLVPFDQLVYVRERSQFVTRSEVSGETVLTFSEHELQDHLDDGGEIPQWYADSEVIAELRRSHPPRSRQGLTVFFTGLSGSGKSTIARVLQMRMLEKGGRQVTLLDGDLVRKNLSSELGFSKEHRILNIMRIGFVANEITKNGGMAICAPIAPYSAIRDELRKQISGSGGFILVHVATTLETCESRDRKGLYAKARAGIIPEFTGISDPYEIPENAEIQIETVGRSPEECADQVIEYLEQHGYLL